MTKQKFDSAVPEIREATPAPIDVTRFREPLDGVERRWREDLAPRLGLDPKLTGFARFAAVKKRIAFNPTRRGEPNLTHMTHLLQAVRDGKPFGGRVVSYNDATDAWPAYFITRDEVAAAQRAVNRSPQQPREPGQDDEERGGR